MEQSGQTNIFLRVLASLLLVIGILATAYLGYINRHMLFREKTSSTANNNVMDLKKLISGMPVYIKFKNGQKIKVKLFPGDVNVPDKEEFVGEEPINTRTANGDLRVFVRDDELVVNDPSKVLGVRTENLDENNSDGSSNDDLNNNGNAPVYYNTYYTVTLNFEGRNNLKITQEGDRYVFEVEQGSGSGLDADTLDGKDASNFMLSSTDNWIDTTGDTMTGPLYNTSAYYLQNANGTLSMGQVSMLGRTGNGLVSSADLGIYASRDMGLQASGALGIYSNNGLAIDSQGGIGIHSANDNISLDGNRLDINSNVMPVANNAYTMGTNTNRWSDIYVGPNSIHIGTSDDEGTISYDVEHNTIDIDKAITVNGKNVYIGDYAMLGYTGNALVANSHLGIQSTNGNLGIQSLNGAVGVYSKEGIAIDSEQGIGIHSAYNNISLDGNRLDINSDVMPVVNNAYSMGTDTNRWKDVYVGPDSIHIGNKGNEVKLNYDTNAQELNIDKGVKIQTDLYLGEYSMLGQSGLAVVSSNTLGLQANNDLGIQSLNGAIGIYSQTGIAIDSQGGIGIHSANDNISLDANRIDINSNVMPIQTNTYTLGTDTNRWKDVYVGPNSIHIGKSGDEAKISYDTEANTLEIDKNAKVDGEITATGTFKLERAGTVYFKVDSNGDITAGDMDLSGDLSAYDVDVKHNLTIGNTLTADTIQATNGLFDKLSTDEIAGKNNNVIEIENQYSILFTNSSHTKELEINASIDGDANDINNVDILQTAVIKVGTNDIALSSSGIILNNKDIQGVNSLNATTITATTLKTANITITSNSISGVQSLQASNINANNVTTTSLNATNAKVNGSNVVTEDTVNSYVKGGSGDCGSVNGTVNIDVGINNAYVVATPTAGTITVNHVSGSIYQFTCENGAQYFYWVAVK